MRAASGGRSSTRPKTDLDQIGSYGCSSRLKQRSHRSLMSAFHPFLPLGLRANSDDCFPTPSLGWVQRADCIFEGCNRADFAAQSSVPYPLDNF